MSLLSCRDSEPGSPKPAGLPLLYSVLPSKLWRLTGYDEKVFDVLPEERIEWIDIDKYKSLVYSVMSLKCCSFEQAAWEIYEDHLTAILLEVPRKKAIFEITRSMTVFGVKNIRTGHLSKFNCAKTVMDGDELSVHVCNIPKEAALDILLF